MQQWQRIPSKRMKMCWYRFIFWHFIFKYMHISNIYLWAAVIKQRKTPYFWRWHITLKIMMAFKDTLKIMTFLLYWNISKLYSMLALERRQVKCHTYSFNFNRCNMSKIEAIEKLEYWLKPCSKWPQIKMGLVQESPRTVQCRPTLAINLGQGCPDARAIWC